MLAESVPHILSVNLLDFFACTIDLPRNQMEAETLAQTIVLTRLASGHRMADTIGPLREPWEIPDSAFKSYPGYPFLTAMPFSNVGGSTPKMLEDGSCVVNMCFFLLLIALLFIRVSRASRGRQGTSSGSRVPNKIWIRGILSGRLDFRDPREL